VFSPDARRRDEAGKDAAITPRLPVDRKATTFMCDVAVNIRIKGSVPEKAAELNLTTPSGLFANP